jgi:hypothetical protein
MKSSSQLPLGVAKIDRQRIAVRLARALDAFLFQPAMHPRRPANSAMRNEIWLMALKPASAGRPLARITWWCPRGRGS